MSPMPRHRRATATAVTLFVGVPLVLVGVAFAGPAELPTASVRDSGEKVVFTGDGVPGVACRAKPSRTSVRVPGESTVRMVNDMETDADLLIDGVPSGVIEGEDSQAVLIHRGPVVLALKPHCVLAEQGPVMVDVDKPPPTPGTPTATPTTAEPGPTVSGSPRPTSGAQPSARPTRSSAAAVSATATPSTDNGWAVASGNGAADSRPAGGAKGATGRDSGWKPSQEGTPPSAVAASEADRTLNASNPPPANAAAEPLANATPARGSQPIALLALIAAIAVVGVSVGAIRAIIAQRVRRTSAHVR
jgi:hypothetical protein